MHLALVAPVFDEIKIVTICHNSLVDVTARMCELLNSRSWTLVEQSCAPRVPAPQLSVNVGAHSE